MQLILQTILVVFHKLRYLGHVSTDVKRKINRLCKFYCQSLNIKIVLTPFKISDKFSMEDSIPKSLKSFVAYKFVHAIIPVPLVRQLPICQQ